MTSLRLHHAPVFLCVQYFVTYFVAKSNIINKIQEKKIFWRCFAVLRALYKLLKTKGKAWVGLDSIYWARMLGAGCRAQSAIAGHWDPPA
jgi:hypothetical protein